MTTARARAVDRAYARAAAARWQVGALSFSVCGVVERAVKLRLRDVRPHDRVVEVRARVCATACSPHSELAQLDAMYVHVRNAHKHAHKCGTGMACLDSRVLAPDIADEDAAVMG